MTEESIPIAYTALQPGTAIQSSDEHTFGWVETVLVVGDVDVFDGIVITTDEGIRFVDADYVAAIFTTHVLTTLSPGEVADLPLPDQAPSFQADASDDTGDSLADRFGRMFGRGKWKRE